MFTKKWNIKPSLVCVYSHNGNCCSLVSAVADGPKRIALCGERNSEMGTLQIGPWIKDRILLIDLGFYKYNTFAHIDENGGYFVSRIKSKVDPLIIGTNRTWRGRSIDIVGKRLSEVLPIGKYTKSSRYDSRCCH